MEILTSVLICGVVPYRCLDYMEYDREMIRRVARNLIKEGVLKMEHCCNEKVLVFTPRGLENIENGKLETAVSENLLQFYKSISRQYKNVARRSEESEARRALQNSDVMMFMHYSGIGSFFSEKLSLSELSSNPGVGQYYSLKDIRDIYDIGITNTAVSSKKQKVNVGTRAISSTRANGVVFSPEGKTYVVYGISTKPPVWFRSGEMGFLTRVRRIAQDRRMKSEDEGIILYSGDSVLEKILNYKKSRGFATMNIDLSLDHMYAIPEDAYGQIFINIIMEADWQKKILSKVLTLDEIEGAKRASILVDGYSLASRVYSCVFCVPDLVKLKSIQQHAKAAQDPSGFIIYCYEYQESFIRSNFEGLAQIKVVGFKDVVGDLS